MAIVVLVLLLLMLFYGFLIERYRNGWNSIVNYQRDSSIEPKTFISVIVPMRNEEHNVSRIIDSFKNQSYPSDLFEVIIIDDHSSDTTWQLVHDTDHGQLDIKLFKLSDLKLETAVVAFKKLAIELGVKKANGQLIITTDADCVFKEHWLRSIESFYQQTGAKCIAGPVLIRNTGTLLSIFQSLDFLTLQGITGAALRKQLHIMCNGANFIYEKSAFEEAEGYRGSSSIPSGDDMFLMQKIWSKYPEKVYYLKSVDAIVTTDPETTLGSFIQQRIRWAGKSASYGDNKILYILLTVYAVNVCLVILAIAILFNPYLVYLLILFLAAKILIEYPFVGSVARFFSSKTIMRYFIIFQPLHIVYTVVAGFFASVGNYQWKGRTVTKPNKKGMIR